MHLFHARSRRSKKRRLGKNAAKIEAAVIMQFASNLVLSSDLTKNGAYFMKLHARGGICY